MRPEELKHARILVVDDEETNVQSLKKILARAGYGGVEGTTEPGIRPRWRS